MNLRKAAEMALERLESHEYWMDEEAIQALSQAIAEAEKQEPVAFRNTETGEFCTGGFLRKDLAKWQPVYTTPVACDDDIYDIWVEQKPVHANDISQDRVDETAKSEHEPVAWMHNFIEGTVITHEPADIGRHPDRWTPLYTAPPKRE